MVHLKRARILHFHDSISQLTKLGFLLGLRLNENSGHGLPQCQEGRRVQGWDHSFTDSLLRLLILLKHSNQQLLHGGEAWSTFPQFTVPHESSNEIIRWFLIKIGRQLQWGFLPSCCAFQRFWKRKRHPNVAWLVTQSAWRLCARVSPPREYHASFWISLRQIAIFASLHFCPTDFAPEKHPWTRPDR